MTDRLIPRRKRYVRCSNPQCCGGWVHYTHIERFIRSHYARYYFWQCDGCGDEWLMSEANFKRLKRGLRALTDTEQWCGGHIVDQKWLNRENMRRGIAA